MIILKEKNMRTFLMCIVITLFLSCNDENKDNNPPVITLEGEDYIYWQKNKPWEDPGYSAFDEEDGDITDNVRIDGEVNVSIDDSTYTLKYNVRDNAGNPAEEKIRKVRVLEF